MAIIKVPTWRKHGSNKNDRYNHNSAKRAPDAATASTTTAKISASITTTKSTTASTAKITAMLAAATAMFVLY